MITKKDLIREIQNQNAGITGYAYLYFRKISRGYEYSRSDEALPPFTGWHRLKAYTYQVGSGFVLTCATAKDILTHLLTETT